MHRSVYRSTVYNSQDLETAEIPINRGMDGEDAVRVYNGVSAVKGMKLCHLQRYGWT